jgi:hypothetical protein
MAGADSIGPGGDHERQCAEQSCQVVMDQAETFEKASK